MEAKQQPPYPLRMPDELRAELEAEAAEVHRSLNAHIVAVLQARNSSKVALEESRELVQAAREKIDALNQELQNARAAATRDVEWRLEVEAQATSVRLAMNEQFQSEVRLALDVLAQRAKLTKEEQATRDRAQALLKDLEAQRTSLLDESFVITSRQSAMFRNKAPRIDEEANALLSNDAEARQALTLEVNSLLHEVNATKEEVEAAQEVADQRVKSRLNKMIPVPESVIRRQIELVSGMVARRLGGLTYDLGDIVPPSQDVGSQHRPASPPKPPRKVASKK